MVSKLDVHLSNGNNEHKSHLYYLYLTFGPFSFYFHFSARGISLVVGDDFNSAARQTRIYTYSDLWYGYVSIAYELTYLHEVRTICSYDSLKAS